MRLGAEHACPMQTLLKTSATVQRPPRFRRLVRFSIFEKDPPVNLPNDKTRNIPAGTQVCPGNLGIVKLDELTS